MNDMVMILQSAVLILDRIAVSAEMIARSSALGDSQLSELMALFKKHEARLAAMEELRRIREREGMIQ